MSERCHTELCYEKVTRIQEFIAVHVRYMVSAMLQKKISYIQKFKKNVMGKCADLLLQVLLNEVYAGTYM